MKLGVYEKLIGQALDEVPMLRSEVRERLKAKSCPYGEAQTERLMDGLVEKGVAKATQHGWVRGPMWFVMADKYGWEIASDRRPQPGGFKL